MPNDERVERVLEYVAESVSTAPAKAEAVAAEYEGAKAVEHGFIHREPRYADEYRNVMDDLACLRMPKQGDDVMAEYHRVKAYIEGLREHDSQQAEQMRVLREERDDWRRIAYAVGRTAGGSTIPGLISVSDAYLSRAKLWVLFAMRDILGLPWEDEAKSEEPPSELRAALSAIGETP